MKSHLVLAASFLLATCFLAGQTTPAGPSGPVASPAATAAATDSAPSAAPDLSFKPAPGDEPAPSPAAPVAKPAAPPQPTSPPAKRPANPGASADAGAAVKNPAQTADMPPYVLGTNDVVQVAVFGEPNVSSTYAIGPDGRISLPLIGDFKAIGMTTHQLGELISKKLEDYIIDPVVNVQLLRSNSKKYTLIGGVGRTGPYPLTQQTTVLDALAAAGGFRDFSNRKKIVIMRGTKKFPFNYEDVIHGKHMEENITLEDGDLIIVPE